jgi:hypothetical protein
MRTLGVCILGSIAVACAGASPPPGTADPPPWEAVPPQAPGGASTRGQPPVGRGGSGPALVDIGWVDPRDQLSIDQIEFVCNAHGVYLGDLIAPAGSHLGTAVTVLREHGPRRGRWGLDENFAPGFQPEPRPEPSTWPELATGTSFRQALDRFPAGNPAGALLRDPVVRSYARAFPRVMRLSGFSRPYLDSELVEHHGLEGTLELGPADSGRRVSFTADFQAWDRGARVVLSAWCTRPVGTGLEPDPVRHPWSAVAETSAGNVWAERWVLATLDGGGLSVFPLPSPPGSGVRRFAVPANQAVRARDLLRSERPEWVRCSVLDG